MFLQKPQQRKQRCTWFGVKVSCPKNLCETNVQFHRNLELSCNNLGDQMKAYNSKKEGSRTKSTSWMHEVYSFDTSTSLLESRQNIWKHLNWNAKDWNVVLFSDSTSTQLGKPIEEMFLQKTTKRFALINLVRIANFEGGSIIYFARITSEGRTNMLRLIKE